MKKVLFGGLAALAITLFVAPASAFEFEADLEGEGSGTFNFELEETESWTTEAGALYNFNGGAGSEGNGTAKGEWTGVGGLFGEYAYGTGDAFSNTLGGNFAQAEFHSGSGSINGGFAADADFAGGNSKMSYDGLVTAGGAGSATTGLTWQNTHGQGWSGAFDYDVDANLDGSFQMNP